MRMNKIKTTERTVRRAAFAAVFCIGMSCCVPSAQAWTPADLPNLALWLDASDATTLFLDTEATQAITNSGAIARWNDKSGNGRNFTQGTVGNRPTFATNSINGLSAANFNGSAGFMSAGDTLDVGTNSLTIMSVVKYATGNQSGVVVSKTRRNPGAGRYALYRAFSGGGFGIGTQYAQFLAVSTSGLGYPQVLDSSTSTKVFGGEWGRLPGYARIWDNGTNTATSTYTGDTNPLDSTDQLWIGAYQSGTGTTPPTAGSFMNGQIAEIVITLSALSIKDRQKLEGYLAWKWGTQASLPADHPYKDPPAGTVFILE